MTKYQALAQKIEEYGVGAVAADPVVVLWAAAKLPAVQAKRELKSLNRRREALGAPLVYAPFGHNAF